MLNLFDSGDFKEDIKTYCSELKEECKRKGLSSKGMHSCTGKSDYVGNCLLILSRRSENISKDFKGAEDKKLSHILKERQLTNCFLTYCYLFPKDIVSRKDIKDFAPWIHRLTRLIRPKLITVLGEPAQLTYLSRKKLLKEYHGQRIGDFDNIPIFLTYNMDYYTTKSEYEDNTFKLFIRNNDWDNIQKEYEKRIT